MSLQEELASMIAAEEMRLGVGSEEFKKRHREIMDQIEQNTIQRATSAPE